MSDPADQIASRAHRIVQSELDSYEYRGLTLRNGLKVLLVSDPTTDRSAAALIVQIGYMTDPWEIPGLAHFCEHMLFCGTKTYPRENYFTEFLSQCGGSSNAYTALDRTGYMFDVTPKHFKEAAGIFADFFSGPLFDAGCTQRELEVVHSEYEHNIKSDHRRVMRIQRVTANPEHDFSKFGGGNRETLCTTAKRQGIDVRQALLNFHDKWYSSNIMSLCLLAKESLDDLANIAIELFGGIEDKQVAAPEWPENPCTVNELGIQVKLIPVEDLNKMVLSFPLPAIRKSALLNALKYISHLINEKCDGSLYSYLKQKGWLIALTSDIRPEVRSFSFFNISLELSPEGFKHTDEIVYAIFQLLDLIRLQGPQRRIVDEIQTLGNLRFRFKPRDKPIQYALYLAENIRKYGWRDVLSADFLVSDCTLEQLKDLLSHLIPEKLRILLISKTFEGLTDQVEQYFNIEYRVERIPDSKISAWETTEHNSELYFPMPNEFIPTNLSLVSKDDKYAREPLLLINEPHDRVWFLQDVEFNLPTAITSCQLRSPLLFQDPLSVCLAHMAVKCFNDSNGDYFHPALLAGNTYRLSNNKDGLFFEVYGYSDIQLAILRSICQQLANFRVDTNRFSILKDAWIRKLRNYSAEQPCDQATFYVDFTLAEKLWGPQQLLAVAGQGCTPERCEAFLHEVLKKLYVETFILGNFTVEEAKGIGWTIRSVLSSERWTVDGSPNVRDYKLRNAEIYQLNIYNDVHPTNSVYVFYQIGSRFSDDVRTEAATDLFCQILAEPSFHVLRTEEQLGYVVWSGRKETGGSYGIGTVVQADKNPSWISHRIQLFINNYMKNQLETMTRAKFEKHKKATIDLLLEKPKNLKDKSAILFREVSQRTYSFNRNSIKADEIARLSKDDILAFFRQYVAHGASEQRQLVVSIESRSNPGVMGPGVRPTQIITDVDEFKNGHDLFRENSTGDTTGGSASPSAEHHACA